VFSVNRVTLLGNATRDPETPVTASGHPLTVLGLATDRQWTDDHGSRHSETEFHRLVCFGALASLAAERVRKGSPLYVEGRLHTARWNTDHGEASRTEIVVDRLVLLSTRRDTAPDAAENAA
jgi:single-strand DNA-binding protein